MTSRPVRAAAVLVAASLAAVPLRAQPAQVAQAGETRPPPSAREQSEAARRDSVGAVRQARREQARFERIRFRHLPEVPDPGAPDRCDERVGRFCIWRDDGDDVEWAPPPEHADVVEARVRLLGALDSAAARAPGDPWIAGLRVRYRVQAGETLQAARVAGECGAEAWWCAALEGYALHAADDPVGAEAAFGRALSAMPERERDEWTDLSTLLAGDDLRTWRRVAGEEKAWLESRFWWLADPLWSVPGNDRRTAHLARWVAERIQDRSRNPEGISWGDDLGEILLRFGEPIGWERVRQRLGTPMGERASVITHYAPRSWSFLPSMAAAVDPSLLEDEHLELDSERSRTVYAPPYATHFAEMDHQLAVFRRGARAVVVAAYDLDADSVPAGAPVEAALAMARDATEEPRVERAYWTGARGTLRAEVAPEPLVVSVEARARVDEDRRVGRARRALPLGPAPEGVSLSDVLLLAGHTSLPETLDAAAPMARGSHRVRAGERLGLFWEVYGVPAGADTLVVSVTVERQGRPGWLRRVAQRVGLAGEGNPVQVRWRQESDGQPVLARSLAIAVPDLKPGEYSLVLSVAPSGGGPAATARRVLQVER